MDKESAEKNAKLLLESIEAELKNFLQKNPIEKLETIQQRFIQGINPLSLLVDDLIKELKKYEFFEGSPYEEKFMDKRIWVEIRDFQQVYFETFIYYNVMLVFFNLPPHYSPLIKSHREELINKHNLTPRKIKLEILKILGRSFPDEVRHSNKEVFWNDNKKLEFLALYNRYHIVIKNARRDIKPFIKKDGKYSIAESRILSKNEKEILSKYEIPEYLLESTFSSHDQPQDVALDWAKKELKVEYSEEYLRDKLIEARKIWVSRIKKGLIIIYLIKEGSIIIYSIEENPEIQFILMDINFQIGCRYYAVKSIDKDKMDKLKYVTVAKQFTGSPAEFKSGEESNEFLVATVLPNNLNTLIIPQKDGI